MNKHGCYNRKPFKETLMVQDGWAGGVIRNMKTIPFRMSMKCEYDNKATDAGCEGCCWQKDVKDRAAILGELDGRQ